MKLSIKLYANMTSASASCCNQLWTIIEIVPRISGEKVTTSVMEYYSSIMKHTPDIDATDATVINHASASVSDSVSGVTNPHLLVADWFQGCSSGVNRNVDSNMNTNTDRLDKMSDTSPLWGHEVHMESESKSKSISNSESDETLLKRRLNSNPNLDRGPKPLRSLLSDEPNVVIRMRPSTVPDTRNYKWSPKR